MSVDEDIILELTQREQYLSMLVEVQKYLLSFATDHWPDHILSILGQTTQSSRASFYKNHLGDTGDLMTSLKAEWCALDITSVKNDSRLQNLAYTEFSPYWLEHLKKDSSLVVPTAATPDKERDLLQSLQVVSFMLLPLMVHHELFGFICLSDCHKIRLWTTVEVDMLWTVMASVSLYLERVQVELALHAANEKLQQLANLDGLTYIANRRKLDQYLSHEWTLLAYHQMPIAMILCDIDYFKQYNDTYGHLAGDECLRVVAQAIASIIRPIHDIAARYGGEEFAVVLSATDINGAMEVAQMIQATVLGLQIPHETSKASEYVTLSMGVSSVIPDATLSPETLVALADAALYQAKTVGRNCIVSE